MYHLLILFMTLSHFSYLLIHFHISIINEIVNFNVSFTMTKKVLILGASGNIGKPLIQSLLKQGAAVQAASRHGHDIEGAKGIKFDFNSPETFLKTGKGVTDIYVMFPTTFANYVTAFEPILAYALKENIRIVLQTSIEVMTTFNHPLRVLEQKLRHSGLLYSIIRPGWFMEDFFLFYKEQLSSGRLDVPAGSGKLSWVAIQDIVESAATVLLGNEYPYPEFNITGSAVLSFQEALNLITQETGQAVQYQPAQGETLKAYSKDELQLYRGVEQGLSALVSNDFFGLTGMQPMTFKAFVSGHKSQFLEI